MGGEIYNDHGSQLMQDLQQNSFFVRFSGFTPDKKVRQVWRGRCLFPSSLWSAAFNMIVRPCGETGFDAEGEVSLMGPNGKYMWVDTEVLGRNVKLQLVEHARDFNDSRYNKNGKRVSARNGEKSLKKFLSKTGLPCATGFMQCVRFLMRSKMKNKDNLYSLDIDESSLNSSAYVDVNCDVING